ncbi:MAG TPA: ABC transporter ATP-binding protein [Phycisphaerales bacterium]|nr:ABC transporter ATP-binding protein [Phycisphaerales bacterium]
MIEAKGLTKSYGTLTALDDLSLSIGPGEVYGFIGPNGAGKSTTMKILSCLLKPDSGRASVCGLDVRTRGDDVRRVLGYMPDFLGVYEDLTVDEYLQFFAAAFGIERRRRRATIDGVLELTDLVAKKNAPVEGLSRGMQQRLGVARVLVHDPKVLLLDEPSSGLDPRARIEMRELLIELGKMGKCLMISSHILTELAEMCTSIGIIERGKLLYTGSIKDAYARARGGERISVRLEEGPVTPARVCEVLAQDARVQRARVEPAVPDAADMGAQIGGEIIRVDLNPGEHGHHFLLEIIIATGARIAAFTPEGMKLEEAFLKLTTGALQ